MAKKLLVLCFLISLTCVVSLAHAADMGEILCGQTVNASVGDPDPTDSFWFYGQDGQGVVIEMAAVDGAFYPVVAIFRPDGTLARKYDVYPFDAHLPARIEDLQLDQTGVWTIVASSHYGGITGEYGLSFVLMPSLNCCPQEPDGCAMASGSSYAGTMSLGDTDAAQLYGRVGQGIVIEMAAVDGAFWPVVAIFRPDGTLARKYDVYPFDAHLPARIEGFQLDQTGIWTVVGSSHYGATGQYGLSYLVMPGPASSPQDPDGGATASAQTWSGTLTPCGDTDACSFYGETGQGVTVEMGSGGAFYPVVALFRPNGTLARKYDVYPFDAHLPARIEGFQLDQTGIWTVVGSSHYAASGTYSLSCTRIPPVPAPPIRDPVPANESTICETTALFGWSAVEGATGYDLYFGEDVVYELDKIGDNIPSPSFPIPQVERGKTYYWRAVAHTAGGDIEGPYWWFQVGPCPPEISINGGAACTTLASVTLTISCPADCAAIRFKDAGGTWTAWQPCTGTRSWTLPAGDGLKTICAQCRDAQMNESAVVCDDITLDSTPPAAPGISINGGRWCTTSRNVTLVITCPADCDQIRFKDAGGSWSAWQPCASTKSWTLPAGDGTKTVLAQCQDACGNVGPAGWDSITLDTTGPAAPGISINGGAWCTTSRNVTLTITCAAGCAEIRFKDSGGSWTAWQPCASTKSWTLPAGDGTKTVLAQCRDACGNGSPEGWDSIWLDTAGPTNPTISINAGAPCANSAGVTLSLSATGAAQMRLRNDPGAWGAWQTYASTQAWTLPAGDGTKRVCVQYRDACGNPTAEMCDGIVLDTAPPSLTLGLSPTAFNACQYQKTTFTYTVSEKSLVKLTVYNATGQPVRYLVWEWKEKGTYTVQWDGKDSAGSIVPEGQYRACIWGRDQCGKESVWTCKIVLVQCQPPQCTLSALPATFKACAGEKTTFTYGVNEKALVKLSVYDMNNSLRRYLVWAWKEAGSYTVQWDGKDNAGNLVPEGWYRAYMWAQDVVGLTCSKTVYVKVQCNAPTCTVISTCASLSPYQGQKCAISYQFDDDSHAACLVKLQIARNSDGALVREIVSAYKSPGQYSAEWDGRDAGGSIVPAGDYRVVLRVRDVADQECVTSKCCIKVILPTSGWYVGPYHPTFSLPLAGYLVSEDMLGLFFTQGAGVAYPFISITFEGASAIRAGQAVLTDGVVVAINDQVDFIGDADHPCKVVFSRFELRTGGHMSGTIMGQVRGDPDGNGIWELYPIYGAFENVPVFVQQ